MKWGGGTDEAVQQRVEAEIRARFDAYETALVTNDVESLIAFFWDDPRAVRLGPDGGSYGFDEIAGFRKARSPDDLARTLTKVDIHALSPEIGVANAEYQRTVSGRKGAQTQVWTKRDGIWRIISAHVSLRT